ncbi:hypothetical protein NDU88_005856 [Pleurodeles waltl]|uniref:Uncharacterized protein n=1 Tax=Pleurodeles waltl TaxID=8319 RepID=A0AAV7QH79_PLEWA|nr:hypothetical protein NDU88_005856 [Pleurodeles waltl]
MTDRKNHRRRCPRVKLLGSTKSRYIDNSRKEAVFPYPRLSLKSTHRRPRKDGIGNQLEQEKALNNARTGSEKQTNSEGITQEITFNWENKYS